MRNMKNTLIRLGSAGLLATSLTLSLSGCGAIGALASTVKELAGNEANEEFVTSSVASMTTTSVANMSTTGAIDTSSLFTDRDLEQTADLTSAQTLTVSSGQDIQITAEGVYVISGTATDVTIYVDADDSAKVQLVLDGASISNTDAPAIYVRSADKVFVTTTEGSTNALEVTGTFVADGDTNVDAVIFSKEDLVLNGLGTLQVNSTGNGVTSKDSLKVTGGSYVVTASADGFEANDEILVSDGAVSITAGKDGIHAEYDEDDTVGMVYICGGSFNISATDDAIQATTILQIDDGTFALSAAECLEATYVQVNGGTIDIAATDDGINATTKSASMGTPTIEVTGGSITIAMGSGDTDALDANGSISVSGGTIDITAQSAFDIDGTASFTGGTITVNGEQVTEITNSMMMGGPGQMGGGDMQQDGMGGQGPQGGMGPQGGGFMS